MGFKEISSVQHPSVKHLVRLREQRDYRYQCRRVVVSGLKLVRELSSRCHFRTLFLENGFTPHQEVKADAIYSVSPQILKKVTGLQNPEPVAAEIEMPRASDLSSARRLLVLDGVSDPGNLGTLLRTASALGWDGAWLTPGSTDPFNDKAIRAAKGATFTFPWRSGTWEELAVFLQEKKMSLFAADPEGGDIAGYKVTPPLALALGNEANGLTLQLKKSATLIGIPMDDCMESLNVASAGSILLYALRGSCITRFGGQTR